ncbi:MAG: hypothetical protein ACI4RD_02565 [Kiritimatiellia bacterium]
MRWLLTGALAMLTTGGLAVKGDCPQVVLTEHPFADGTSAVVAINGEPRAQVCTVALRGRLGRVWRGEVSAAVFELVR